MTPNNILLYPPPCQQPHRCRLAVADCNEPPPLPGAPEGPVATAVVGAAVTSMRAYDLALGIARVQRQVYKLVVLDLHDSLLLVTGLGNGILQ